MSSISHCRVTVTAEARISQACLLYLHKRRSINYITLHLYSSVKAVQHNAVPLVQKSSTAVWLPSFYCKLQRNATIYTTRYLYSTHEKPATSDVVRLNVVRKRFGSRVCGYRLALGTWHVCRVSPLLPGHPRVHR